MITSEIKKELITIYQTESDKADTLSLKNHLLNQIKQFEHKELASECIKMGMLVPPMDKLPTLNEYGNHTPQFMINLNKKLQAILSYHFKYNTNISDETRNYLNDKLGSLYKKVGKNIEKRKDYKERIYNKYLQNQ
jgi:hypothetical protein